MEWWEYILFSPAADNRPLQLVFRSEFWTTILFFVQINYLDLSEYTRLEHKKHNLSQKNCFLEIDACNLEAYFIYEEHSM